MRKTSKKQSIINNKKHKLKQELLEENPYCSGCGTNHSLTLSHIINIPHRKDLETCRDNVVLDCLKCHHIWKHGTLDEKKTLMNYDYRLMMMKKLDELYYNRFLINRS